MTQFVTKFKDNFALLKIVGSDSDLNTYLVEFVNEDNGNIEYYDILKVNYWAKLNNIEDKNITIKVKVEDDVVFERNRHTKFNKVYVKFGTTALGDTVAWIPYVEEYRIKHNVKVSLFTHFNFLFNKAYPDIEFVDISNPNLINDVDMKFRIDYGPNLYILNDEISPELWKKENEEYDNYVDDYDYRKISLQSIAKVILGSDKDEIKPRVNIDNDNGPRIKGKYVVVAIQSTAQLKYWNNPFGWERVFDFLGKNGYKIVLIDKHKVFGIIGSFNQAPKSKFVIDKTGDYSLNDRVIDIKYADMVVTISSGLAWLSWAVGTPVIMISGFTDPSNEFQSNIIRIHNKSVCNSCWNDPNLFYKPTDWMFCPRNNNFVCSKVIQPKEVTDAIKKLMK